MTIMCTPCFKDRDLKKAQGKKYRVVYFMPKCKVCGKISHTMRLNADFNSLAACNDCSCKELFE